MDGQQPRLLSCPRQKTFKFRLQAPGCNLNIKLQVSSFRLQAGELQASSFIISMSNDLDININSILDKLQACCLKLHASGLKLQASSTNAKLQILQTSSRKSQVSSLKLQASSFHRHYGWQSPFWQLCQVSTLGGYCMITLKMCGYLGSWVFG